MKGLVGMSKDGQNRWIERIRRENGIRSAADETETASLGEDKLPQEENRGESSEPQEEPADETETDKETGTGTETGNGADEETEGDQLQTIVTVKPEEQKPAGSSAFSPWMAGCAVLLAVGIAEAAVLLRLKKKQQNLEEVRRGLETEIATLKEWKQVRTDSDSKSRTYEGSLPAPAFSGRPVQSVGRLHHIGMRKNQQDSFGVTQTGSGMLAVVADGMGGLADGEKVSQRIVQTMIADASRISPGQSDGVLYHMAAHANTEVSQMLGREKLYQSGSTLIAVLAERESFQWVSIGDSRIYLYRGGALLQINREHIYETELLEKAANHEITFAEARRHAKRKSLTSFIGMGELKHMDGSMRPVRTQRGDRILLMSDGVFNTLTEDQIAAVLKQYSRAEEAAAALERAVLAAENPRQDNFTAIIINYD